jgi:hypothetical protein
MKQLEKVLKPATKQTHRSDRTLTKRLTSYLAQRFGEESEINLFEAYVLNLIDVIDGVTPPELSRCLH